VRPARSPGEDRGRCVPGAVVPPVPSPYQGPPSGATRPPLRGSPPHRGDARGAGAGARRRLPGSAPRTRGTPEGAAQGRAGVFRAQPATARARLVFTSSARGRTSGRGRGTDAPGGGRRPDRLRGALRPAPPLGGALRP